MDTHPTAPPPKETAAAALADHIAEHLIAGATIAGIQADLGCSRHAIEQVRSARRIPARPRGPRPQTDAERFTARTQPAEGGHLQWTGQVRPDGVPILGSTSAYRFAWRQQTGQQPTGIVRSTCDAWACVARDHLKCVAPQSLAAAVTSLEHLAELLAARTVHVEPGGHRRWTGRFAESTPVLRYGHGTRGAQSTAYRFVWLLHTGRDPDGVLQVTCDVVGCVAFDHLAVTAGREDDGDA